MSIQPQPTPRHAPALDRLVEMGMNVATRLHDLIVPPAEQDAAPPEPATLVRLAAAFDRASRGVRRTILLAHKIEQPPRSGHHAARRRILRAVEDTIQRHADGPEADALTAELHERLDGIDVIEDIATRPVPDIVTEICRDLGLGDNPPGTHPWGRRTPSDIAALCTRAAFDPGPAHPPHPAGEHLLTVLLGPPNARNHPS